MNDSEKSNNIKSSIKEVIGLIGKEGCVKCYEFQQNRLPKIYAYGCEILGGDVIEYVKSL